MLIENRIVDRFKTNAQKRNIGIWAGNEIKRDSKSSGERNWISLVKFVSFKFL